MRVTISAAVCAALLLSAMPAVSANDGSIVDSTYSTLYVHIDDVPNYWINSNQNDPAHTDDGRGYNPLGYVITGEVGEATWNVAMNLPLSNDVELDSSGTVEMYGYFGGELFDNGAAAYATLELHADGQMIASGTVNAVSPMAAGATGWYEAHVSATPTVTSISAGSTMTYTLKLGGASSQVALGAGEGYWSRAELPVTGEAVAPSGPVQDTLNENNGFSYNFTQPDSRTFLYNYTSESGEEVVTYSANVNNGSASITVKGTEGQSLWDVTIDATAAETTEQLPTAVPGNWTVEVVYTDYNGTISFAFGTLQSSESTGGNTGGEGSGGAGGESGGQGSGNEGTGGEGESGNENTGTGEGSGDGATGGNETAGADDTDDQSTPGPGIALVGAGLMVAALARRRK